MNFKEDLCVVDNNTYPICFSTIRQYLEKLNESDVELTKEEMGLLSELILNFKQDNNSTQYYEIKIGLKIKVRENMLKILKETPYIQEILD